MENKETNNNKKISIWQKLKQELKKEIGIIWQTKKKWIVFTYLLTATLWTILEFSQGWQVVNLLGCFFGWILLFPFIFGLFSIPRIIKGCKRTDKEMSEIVKQAKKNHPQKYYKANLVFEMALFFGFLGLISHLWICFTIPSDNLIIHTQIGVIFISFYFISFLFCLLFVLYCREINQTKKEPQKTATETLSELTKQK